MHPIIPEQQVVAACQAPQPNLVDQAMNNEGASDPSVGPHSATRSPGLLVEDRGSQGKQNEVRKPHRVAQPKPKRGSRWRIRVPESKHIAGCRASHYQQEKNG
jgi:hypothetical protein